MDRFYTFVLYMYKGGISCRQKIFCRSGLLFICCCFCFLAEANVRNRGYVLILNSYAETDVWANYAIDSIRKNHSIKENIYVESLDILLEDSVAGLRERKEYILEKYDSIPRCVVMVGEQYMVCIRGFV